MTEEAALLRVVLDDPDADAPRLAYADWCGRQEGEAWIAREEFIRTQIRLDHTDPDLVRRGRTFGMQHRIGELSDRFGEAWAGPLAELVEGYSFQRGFIGLVKMRARSFLEHGERLFTLAPVQHLDLVGVRDVDEKLFFSPLLGRLRSLSMNACGLHDLHLQMLAASPEVRNLRWLSVADNHLSLAAAEALAESKFLKGLRFAEFRSNPVDPTERLGMDSGILVSSWLPPEGKDLEQRFGPLAWLHKDLETSRFSSQPSQ
jgi:uncharacterized protein (TIGR02996 family)